jgi:hypothetical protein
LKFNQKSGACLLTQLSGNEAVGGLEMDGEQIKFVAMNLFKARIGHVTAENGAKNRQ